LDSFESNRPLISCRISQAMTYCSWIFLFMCSENPWNQTCPDHQAVIILLGDVYCNFIVPHNQNSMHISTCYTKG
jgi:hypothetical protein